MKIGIIGAMDEEVRILREAITEPREWQEAGALFISGNYGDHEVVVVRSGIGKVLAAITATLLISHYKVDCLINTGSAGGIGEGMVIGDIVVSDKLAYFDVDVTAFGYQKGQMAGMPLFYEADEILIKASKLALKEEKVKIMTGLIVSGDSFIDKSEKVVQIKSDFPSVLANEMEGAAIAHVAFQYKVPFVVIRAISDVADSGASVDFDSFIIESGKKSAKLVLALIRYLT